MVLKKKHRDREGVDENEKEARHPMGELQPKINIRFDPVLIRFNPRQLPLLELLPSRPEAAASNALCVPQARDLRSASFIPGLTAVALAVRLMVPVISVLRGPATPRVCALPGALKKKWLAVQPTT